jgi:hypothetical protein
MLVSAVVVSGCRRSGPAHIVPLTKAEENLKYIAMAYSDALEQNGKAPKGVEDLKPYLKSFGDPDELLTSPNDGKPFVIVWSANLAGGPTEYKGLFPILAYEAKGAGGQRAVTDIRGRPMTVPREDFSKLKFVGRHKPADD